MANKKINHKRSSTKSHSLITKKRTNYSLIFTISFIGVLAIIVIAFNKRTLMQSVAGVSIVRGVFAEAAIPIQPVPGAAGYNLYYKLTSDQSFVNSLRNIPVTSTTATIGYLKKGGNYVYQIAAYDTTGKEFYFSPIEPMTNLQSM